MPFRKRFIGFDLSGTNIHAVHIEKEKKRWKLVNCHTDILPPETVRYSFKTNNIIDNAQFLKTIRGVFAHIASGGTVVGLSLPNEIVNLSIHKYDELPKSKTETEKMLSWRTEKSLQFPKEMVKISYQSLGSEPNGEKSVLVALGFHEVIREYEERFKELKIGIKMMQPASINQYNFFSSQLPHKGTFAYVGLFEYYFTIFIFEDGRLISYQGVKKGFADLHFILDVDIALQHYRSLNPGKKINRMYVGSQVGFRRELEDVLSNLSDMKVYILDPHREIEIANDLVKRTEEPDLSLYVSAIGAAQSFVL